MVKPYSVPNKRKTSYPINDIFTKRWSPRSMSGEKMTKRELMSLFEAAHWAPSNGNSQSWRFLYATKGSRNWKMFFDLLVEFNQMWVKNAAVLVLVISKKTFGKDKKNAPSPTHSFDTGAAWMSLALQARMNNLITHGMAGFDYDKARKVLKIPKDYQVEAMVAIGKQGQVKDLHPRMQKSEKPNTRKKLSEVVSEGKFNFKKE